MRILAIRGARLASLEQPFEVDLGVEPLRSAGVFAIVGPTGAGKSTLLDALCLALFGTTPRLARTTRLRLEGRGLEGRGLEGRALDARDEGRDDADADAGDEGMTTTDPRTLVRRGAGDAYAEVAFVGVDGRVYTARWSVARGRPDRSGRRKLRNVQMSLRDAEGRIVASSEAGTKTETLSAIEARLGVGWVELRRAVLLPQGELAAFLEAPPDARAALLERITGAQIFGEVSRVVHERASAARRSLEDAERALAACAVLSDAEREAMQARRLASRLAAARAEERLASWIARRDRLAALVRLRQDEREAVARLAEVERQRALAELGRADVEAYERAAPAAARRAALEAAEEALAGVSARAEREAEAERGLEREVAQSAEGLAKAALHAEERLAALRAELAQCQARHQVAGEARRAAEAAVAALPSAELLRARERAIESIAHADERVRQAGARLAEAQGVLAELGARLVALAEAVEPEAARLSESEREVERCRVRLEEAEHALARVIAVRSLADHRARLVEGEPCPLCGATEHALGGLDLPRTVQTDAEERVAALRASLDAGTRGVARARADQSAHARERAELDRRVAAQRGAVAAIERELLQLDTARQRAWEALSNEGRSAPDASTLDALRRGLAADRRAVEAAVAQARAAERALDTARQRAIDAERSLHVAEHGLREHGEAQRQAHARAEERLARARAARIAACAERDRAAAARDEARRAFEAAAADVGVDAEHLRLLLGRDAARIARLRADLARLDGERAAARARLDERSQRRIDEEHALDEDGGREGEALDRAIEEARAERDAARRDEAVADAALAQDLARRDEASALSTRCDAARAEAARWQVLDDDIGSADGKRFRAFAQSLTLDRLLTHANAELAQLSPRYGLVRAPGAGELALAVEDRELGGPLRSVQSLSGGETFLVSLALALGLASMTAAHGGTGALRASSLFLDEGFGALDPDSLEIALGALESLRASGRQVAIVTHVPGVAERFAARVQIVPRGAGRSVVEVVRG